MSHCISPNQSPCVRLRTTIYPSVFAKIIRYAAPFVNTFPDIPIRGYTPDTDSLVLTSYLTVESSYTNVTLTPSDAPPSSVTSAAFQVLPPTFCATSTQPPMPIPTSSLNLNILNPLYTITSNTSSQLPVVLSNVVSLIDGSRIPSFYFPPLVMQFSNVSLATLIPAISNGSSFVFRNDVVWAGPTIPYGIIYHGNPTQSVLDLAGLQGIFGLMGLDTGIFLQRLTLINPVESGEASGTGKTALPLWAFQFNR